MISSFNHSTVHPPVFSPRGRVAALGIALSALLCSSCDTDKDKVAPRAPASAPVEKSMPEADAGKEQAEAREKEWKLIQLRKQVGFLVAQPSHEAALVKIKEALALDPQHSDFLKLKRQVSETLSHRCCGTWLRYDFTQPGATEKDLHGVLWSEELGPNYRGHLFRGRVLLACGKGTLSMRIRVPWEVPESPSASLEYTLGKVKGSEKVKTDAAPFVYEFPQPKKWLKKLASNESQTFEVRVPKRDGTQGTFTFQLGAAKQIADEVLQACKAE